jgi:hypothetical protein
VCAFHWFLFQLSWLPEHLIRWSKGRFLAFLWRLWPPGFDDIEHVDEVIASMLVGRSIEDTLACYRAAIQTKYRDPQLADVFAHLNNKITLPTPILCGQQDMRQKMLPRLQIYLQQI